MKTRTGTALVAAGAAATVVAARFLFPRPTFDFEDRVVVITGARGLALVMARHLVAERARVVLMARDRDELARARRDLEAAGGIVRTIVCDITDREQAWAAIQEAASFFGRIDVLINNAGIIQAGPFEHMQLEDYDRAMSTHFWGPLYLTLAALPHLRRQRTSRIVNISSIGGKIAVPHLLPYCASKFALTGLSDGMRAELAKDGIRVTTVAPGLMRTGSPLNAEFKGRHRAEFAWFAISSALPLFSIDADRAARKILASCRTGDPDLTITPQAKLAVIANAVVPHLVARVMAVAARLLPPPTDVSGNVNRTGWESRSPVAPSIVTRLSDRAAARNNELPTAAGG